MAFEAKRLRIQLPCGEATVQEQPDAARQAQPTIGTQTQTIVTGTATLCRIPSVGCGASCVFPTNPCQDFGSLCGFASPCQRFASPCQGFASPCGFNSPCGITDPCQGFGSACGFNSPCGITDPCQAFASPCGFNSPCGITDPCQGFGSACGFASPRTFVTPTLCDASNDPIVDPGTIVVDPESLPVLREQLEAQLKEVEIAEQAVRDLEQEG